MIFWLNYLKTWLIIKKKLLPKYLPTRKNTYTKFAIVCAPRSGSTWLHTLLNSHPHVISKGEILRRTFEKKPAKSLKSLKESVFRPYSAPIKAVGLKVFYQYFDDEIYREFVKWITDDPSIRIIYIVRESLLSQYVSLKKAEATSNWSHGRFSKDLSKIWIDRNEYNRYRHTILEMNSRSTQLLANHRTLEITYEELLMRTDATMAKVQDFLQVPQKSLFSVLRKQSAGSILSQIENSKDFVDLG